MLAENSKEEKNSRFTRRFRHRLKLVILRISAVCLALAVFLIVVSIVSYYILLYPPLQERVLRIVETKLSEYLSGNITIERFESNLLTYIDIYGLRAVGKSGYGDSVYVGEITARYWLPPLVRKRVHITSAVVTDVRGHIVMALDNDVMLPFLPMKMLDSSFRLISDSHIRYDTAYEQSKEPVIRERKTMSYDIPKPTNWAWRVVLGRARINGISAVYRDLCNDMVGEIVNASATAQFHALDSFSVKLRVPRGASYNSPWWSGDIDTIGASGTITWTGLNVKSMLLKGAGTHVTGSGYLSYFPDGRWDLKADFITSIRPLPILYEFTPGVGKDGIFEGTASFEGKLYEPIYKARVNGYGIVYDGHKIDDLSIDATYDRDEYGRTRVRGSTDVGLFDVSASIFMKDLMHDHEFGNYSVNATLTELNAKEIAKKLNFKSPIPIDSGSVRFSVVGKCFEIPTTVEMRADAVPTNSVGGLIDINAVVRNNDWELDGNWGINRVEGKGRLNWNNGALSGVVNADIPDPSAVSIALIKERVRGRMSIAAEFDANINNARNASVTADVYGNGIGWRGMFADSIDAKLSLDTGKLRLTRANGYLLGRIDSVASYFKQNSIRGHIQADFSMSGGVDDFFLNALVRAHDLRYSGYALDTAAGFVSMANDTIRWNSLYMSGMGTSIESGGSFALKPQMGIVGAATLFNEYDGAKKTAGRVSVSGAIRDDSLNGKCQISSVPLNIFDPWIPDAHRLKGIVSFSGEFSGTVKNPAARVNFKVANPSYSDYNVYSIFGDAILSDSLAIGAAMLRLTEKSEPIELKARLPFLPSSKWKIDETGKRASLIGAYTDKFNVGEAVDFFELSDFEIKGAASLNLEIANIGNGWNTGGVITIPNGYARYLPENISVDSIDFRANLSGALENPNADFTIATGMARMPRLRMNKSSIKGRSNFDTLTIDNAHFVFRDNDFVDVKAQMLYDGIDSVFYNRNFYAQYKISNLPVAIFSRLMPNISTHGGLFNGSGVIYAANGRPLVNGMLSLNGLNLAINDIEPTLGPLNADIRLADSAIQIVDMSSKWGRGSINAQGRTQWNMDKLHNVNLSVKGADLFFELPEVVNVGITGANLRISDKNDNIVMNGKVNLGPTSYIRDLNFIELINQAQIGKDVHRNPNPLLQSIRLNIDLNLADNLSVDMNLGTLLMDGRITLAGTLADPVFMGKVTVSDGFVYYLDRKFKIVEGSLFNPDMTAINPNLKIIAELDVETASPTGKAEYFTITLSLAGTLENPVVRFTADPALSELDILSILTFGERMGGMGGDFNSRLTNIAAQQVLGVGARRLEKLLNLDRVSVSGNVLGTGNSQNDGVKIGVSKRLSSRFNLTYETNTGDILNERKVTARYRLRPNLYLEGQTTSEGENALDLIFRYSK